MSCVEQKHWEFGVGVAEQSPPRKQVGKGSSSKEIQCFQELAVTATVCLIFIHKKSSLNLTFLRFPWLFSHKCHRFGCR